MKNGYLFLIQALTALSLVIAIGCSKNDPTSSSVPDPEGTVTANISESTHIEIVPQNGGNDYGFIGWATPNNISIHGGYSNGYASSTVTYMSICDMGASKGLGNITKIPQAGFSTPSWDINNAVACEVGHGYMIKFLCYINSTPVDSGYVRLYVVESIPNTSGDIMGAQVKYQYPFNP